MYLTVLSDFLISFAINACFAEGSYCIILSIGISSQVQFLHLGGRPWAKFALLTGFLTLSEALFAL